MTANFELACASNKTFVELHKSLDPDLFDRLSHLIIDIPSLIDCKEEILSDFEQVITECNPTLSEKYLILNDKKLKDFLFKEDFPGNFRDLQKLAYLILAWLDGHSIDKAVKLAIDEWNQTRVLELSIHEMNFGNGTRDERIAHFKKNMAIWAKKSYGTWSSAAKVLNCNEKTLREDAKLSES